MSGTESPSRTVAVLAAIIAGLIVLYGVTFVLLVWRPW